MKYRQSELDQITKFADPEIVLDFYNIEGYVSGSSFIGLCPFHDDTNSSFGMSLDTGIWHCFTCGEKGNLFQFIQYHEKVKFPQAVEKLMNIVGYKSNKQSLEYTSSLAKLFETARKDKLRRTNEITKTVLPYGCESALNHYHKVKSRVNPAAIQKFDIKYIPSGTNKGKMIIPLYFEKMLVGWFERDMLGIHEKSKKYSKGSPIGKVFYNWDNAIGKDYVIIVEGMLDCIKVDSYGYNCIALLGIQMSDEKKLLLLKNFERVYIALDNDNKKKENYGQIAAKKIAERLKSEIEVYNILLPYGKDPDESSLVEFRTAFKRATKF